MQAFAPGCLVGLSRGAQNQRFQLFTDTSIGRSTDNENVVCTSDPARSKSVLRVGR